VQRDFSSFALAFGLCFLAWHVVRAQDTPAHSPVVPLSPAELIKYLPAAPQDWKLKESKAHNSFLSWILTTAEREFDHQPLALSGAQAAPIQITRVQIRDTGYYPAFLGLFRNFKAGSSGGERNLMVAGFPAHESSFNSGMRLDLLVNGRFIVQIEVQNQDPTSAEQAVALVNLKALGSITASGGGALPNPIDLSTVDELNPGRNTHSELQWMTKEAMEVAAARPPPQ
jgi:hypothetical protein